MKSNTRRSLPAARRLGFAIALAFAVTIAPSPAAAAPETLEYVGCVGGERRGVAVEGNITYLAEGDAVVILDTGTPGKAEVLARHRLPLLDTDNLAVRHSIVYAPVRGGGVAVIDCRDPRNPKSASMIEDMLSYGLWISGDLLIVHQSSPRQSVGTAIYSLVDPLSPLSLAGDTVREYAVWVAEITSLRAPPPEPIECSRLNFTNRYIFVADGDGEARVLCDAATPESEGRTWLVHFPEDPANQDPPGLSHGWAELKSRNGAVEVTEIDTGRREEQPRGSPDISPGSFIARSVILEPGNRLRVYGEQEVAIVDVSNPVFPRILEIMKPGSPADPEAGPPSSLNLVLRGGKVEIAEGADEGGGPTIEARDNAGHPENPAFTITHHPRLEHAVGFTGDLFFTSFDADEPQSNYDMSDESLYAYDVRNILQPRLLLTFPGLNAINDVAVSGDYFFVADGPGGLVILRRPAKKADSDAPDAAPEPPAAAAKPLPAVELPPELSPTP